MSFYCFSWEGRGGSTAAVCSWLHLMTVCKRSYPLWVMMCTFYELTWKSPMKCGFSHVFDSKCEQVVLFLKSVWIPLENRPTGRIQDFRPPSTPPSIPPDTYAAQAFVCLLFPPPCDAATPSGKHFAVLINYSAFVGWMSLLAIWLWEWPHFCVNSYTNSSGKMAAFC